MQTHRHIAKRKTVLWQATAVAVLAAAGAAIALPGVGDFFAVPPPAKPAPITAAPPVPPPDYSKFDIGKLRDGSASASAPIAPKPTENPVATAAVPEDTKPQTIAASASEWAYQGSIITQTNRHALVKIDGQQQICTVGTQHHDTKLVAIEPDHIEVETAGARKTIQLAARTMVTPMEGPKVQPVFRAGARPGMPAGAPGPMVTNTGRMMPNAAPATLEQARLAAAQQAAAVAAADAAEAARRNEAALRGEGGMIPFGKLDAEEVQTAAKYLTDPSLDDGSRMKYLSMIGITPGTSVDQALVRAKEAGVDLGSDAGKMIIHSIETNAKSQGNK